MKKIAVQEKVIFICDGKKCGRYSKEIRKGFKAAIKKCGLKPDVQLVRMDCTDNCKTAPVICLQPQNLWMVEVTREDVQVIFEQYINNQQKL